MLSSGEVFFDNEHQGRAYSSTKLCVRTCCITGYCTAEGSRSILSERGRNGVKNRTRGRMKFTQYWDKTISIAPKMSNSLCEEFNIRPELKSGPWILFPWKLQSEDKCWILCLKTLIWSFAPGLKIEAASQCQSDSNSPGKSGPFYLYWSDFKR